MDNYKFTKGKWKIEDIKSPYETTINSSEYRIAEVKHFEGKNFNDPIEKEAKANALLISKAPEMLEMIQSLIEAKNNGNDWDSEELFIKAEVLIKESTEL